MLVIGAVSQMSTLIVFASDLCNHASCRFSIGAGLAIGSSILAVLAAVALSVFSQEKDFSKPDHVGGELVFAVPGTVTIRITVRWRLWSVCVIVVVC